MGKKAKIKYKLKYNRNDTMIRSEWKKCPSCINKQHISNFNEGSEYCRRHEFKVCVKCGHTYKLKFFAKGTKKKKGLYGSTCRACRSINRRPGEDFAENTAKYLEGHEKRLPVNYQDQLLEDYEQ